MSDTHNLCLRFGCVCYEVFECERHTQPLLTLSVVYATRFLNVSDTHNLCLRFGCVCYEKFTRYEERELLCNLKIYMLELGRER